MTRWPTRTQVLAQSVNVNVLFFPFGDDEHGADPIVGVFRDEASIEAFAAAHDRKIEISSAYWQEIPLRGPDLPYATWPDLQELFLVTEGGIGDDIGDTEIDPVALAIFVDREGAEAFARAEHNPNVVVRKVPLEVELAIPSGITGDPYRY